MDDDRRPGESGILARILPLLTAGVDLVGGGGTEVGPGDDAAVLRLPSDRLVVTTDTVVEGHDFLREATCPHWIGHRAAVQNLADIAAMGARPLALVAAVSARADTPVDAFEELTTGLVQRAAADGAVVVGGDLGRAEQLTVTVTALGTLDAGQEPILRSGARPGDVLAIGASRLGRSAAGLALVLTGRVRVDSGTSTAVVGSPPVVTVEGIEDPSAPSLVAWHDAPDPELSRGWGSGRRASAMMDLSDGLVRDGGRLAAASAVHLDLDRSTLAQDVEPLAGVAAELGADAWRWVLHGGEEHAMLATFPPGDVPPGFRSIGRVMAQTGPDDPLLSLDGEAIAGRGFDHFA